jgi:hypothetical protein
MNPILQAALHHQMSTLQDIIKRMAENSRNVKTWCVTIVSALLAFSTKTLALPWFVLILPILPLMYLDMYYLALETYFRQRYNFLVSQIPILEKMSDFPLNLYEMPVPVSKAVEKNGKGEFSLNICYQFKSKSVWPFYGLLLLLVAAIGYFLTP